MECIFHRVLVCGGRDFSDEDKMYKVLRELHDFNNHPFRHRVVVIVEGGADGADTYARTVGRSLGFMVETYPANWKKYKKRAGTLRNLEMLNTNPDLVIAFPTAQSRGTWHTICEAKKRGIPVDIYES